MEEKGLVTWLFVSVSILVAAVIVISAWFMITPPLNEPSFNNPLSTSQNACSEESRNADTCITLDEPACGWFGNEVKCLRRPCTKEYSNSCEACKDTKVAYWTKGECPN